LRDEDLEGVARVVGLAWPAALSAIQNGKYNDVIDASVEQALELDARNAPTFFINGRRLSSALPYETFERAMEAALGDARRLLERGVPRSDVYRELMRDAKTLSVPRVAIEAPVDDNPSWGQSDAPVVIQMFADFQDPFTARAAPTLKQVQQAYPKQVRIVWRYLPLPFRKHAALAAEAAHEVYEQKGNDAFWKFQALLLDNRDALEPAQLEIYARSINGVDPVRFATALTQRSHTARVARDIEAANKAGITGTPTFSINGELLAGAQPFPRFQKAILAALQPAE
jgi:protein-disulfide isomerase